jgi:outer membrane protein insertion porin family
MKSKKVILICFFFVLTFSVAVIHAQETKPEETVFSLNDKNSPFKEGETIIAEVTFTGLDSATEFYYNAENGLLLFESSFREVLLPGRWGQRFFPNDKFSREKVKELIKILTERASKDGYLEAKVSVMGEKLSDNRMRLIVSVERGGVARVSEIRFVGNKNVSSSELVEGFKSRDDLWTIYRKWHYKHYLEDSSRRVMFSKGFLQAKIKNIVPEKTSDGYIVTVEVEEGVRYQIGNIKIEGVKIFTEKEILEMLNQNVGGVADGRDLENFFEKKLKRIYADKGYLQYTSTFDTDYIKPQTDGFDGTVNVRATINEGRIYRISKIYFWEIEENKAEKLLRISGLKVNDIFSQSALETALKNIDDNGEFEPTNIGFSVQLRADEDTGELEIEFDLSKKE